MRNTYSSSRSCSFSRYVLKSCPLANKGPYKILLWWIYLIPRSGDYNRGTCTRALIFAHVVDGLLGPFAVQLGPRSSPAHHCSRLDPATQLAKPAPTARAVGTWVNGITIVYVWQPVMVVARWRPSARYSCQRPRRLQRSASAARSLFITQGVHSPGPVRTIRPPARELRRPHPLPISLYFGLCAGYPFRPGTVLRCNSRVFLV